MGSVWEIVKDDESTNEVFDNLNMEQHFIQYSLLRKKYLAIKGFHNEKLALVLFYLYVCVIAGFFNTWWLKLVGFMTCQPLLGYLMLKFCIRAPNED